jgi:hypothetical protein
MNKGTLVQVRHNEHQGLFIVLEPCSVGSQFIKLYSLKHNRVCFDMIRSLEVICK